MSENLSFLQRNMLSRKVLAEQLNARNEKHDNNARAEMKALHENSFKISGSKVSRDFKEKQQNRKFNFNRLFNETIADIVRVACPIDISSVSTKELVEQIAFSKDSMPTIYEGLNDITNVYQPSTVTDVTGVDSTVLWLGSLAKQTPGKIVSNLISIRGDGLERPEVPGNVNALNVIDTQTVTGATDLEAVNEALSVFRQTFINKFGTAIRESVLSKLEKDKQVLSDKKVLSEGFEGETESAKLIRTKRVKKLDESHVSVISEMFKTIKVLNENASDDQESFLKESVFNTTILETYKALGLVNKSDKDIQLDLYKLRKSYK